MKNDRVLATIVGVLYIIGTAAGVASMFVAAGLTDGVNLLGTVAPRVGAAQLTGLLVLVMGVALAAIPAVIFPVLKRDSEVLAVGYVIFRGGLETLTYVAVALCWFVLAVIAQQAASAGPVATAQLASLGALVVKAQEPITAIQNIVFSIGALMLYYVMFRAELTPRWLAGWGFVGAISYGIAGVIAVFSTNLEFLLIPLGVQEMVMAVWLIAVGFGPGKVARKRTAQPLPA
jgi:hypothetical protein